MDFALSEDQLAIGDLTAKILAEKGSHEQQRALEKRGGPRFDRELWRAVADAGLLGISVPEEYAGAGLGFLEVAAILEQVGRRSAPIPLFETVVLAALPIAEFGSAAQRSAWLPKIASGEAIGTAALVEDAPSSAARDGDGFRLSGKKLCVPAAELADVVLVPAEVDASGARSPQGREAAAQRGEAERSASPRETEASEERSGGETFFLVDPKAPGVSLDAMATTSGMPESLMTLSGVRVDPDAVLGGIGGGAKLRAWLELRATAALCMISLGACEAALDLTSEYIKTRKQFDQPIAMFQAVGHRAADAFIDTEAIRLTSWQAAWRISAGLDAAKQVAVAKFWCAEGAKRVVHAATHLHGGVGVDKEYPLHRYFLYARHLELALGGGTPQLLKLGKLLAAE
jgi:alkylation response protein AidB-like acyl-CoA dehydrogenase